MKQMQCINIWMDYDTMISKETKWEIYTNTQNLSWAGALYTALATVLKHGLSWKTEFSHIKKQSLQSGNVTAQVQRNHYRAD